jgi:hypothetical protein
MNDRPNAQELLAAARQFLEKELTPALTDPRLKFQTLITANVLAMLEREFETEQAHLEVEYAELTKLLGGLVSPTGPPNIAALRQAVLEANRQFCERIRTGDFDGEEFASAVRVVRASVERKLQVANPRYLASYSRS